MQIEEQQVITPTQSENVERTLVVDTATAALTVALFERDTLVADVTLMGHKQHGERLVDVVAELMAQVGWTPQSVTHLSVGVGPGSYTGVRVGVTFAKTWAVSQPVRLTQFSSLALMAALTEKTSGTIISLMDARRMSAYIGIYEWQQRCVQPLGVDAHVDWAKWLHEEAPQILQNSGLVTFVGEQPMPFVALFQEVFPQIEVRVIAGERAVSQASAWLNVQEASVLEPTELVPVYAHLTVAEQEWLAKQEQVVSQEEYYVEYLEG